MNLSDHPEEFPNATIPAFSNSGCLSTSQLVVGFSEQIMLGLLLSRIAIYSTQTPSNYYYGLLASILYLDMAFRNTCPDDGNIPWTVSAIILVVAHVWLTLRKFHWSYLDRLQRRGYNRVAVSVPV